MSQTGHFVTDGTKCKLDSPLKQMDTRSKCKLLKLSLVRGRLELLFLLQDVTYSTTT